MGGVNSTNIDKCFEWDGLDSDKHEFVKKLIVYLRIYLSEKRSKLSSETTTKDTGD